MTIDFRPEQERVIDQAIQAGLIERPDDVVEVGLEILRSQLQARLGFVAIVTGGRMDAEVSVLGSQLPHDAAAV